MGNVVVNLFITLDGVYQAPGGPDEDREGDFPFGGWQAPLTGDEGEAILAEIESMDALLLGRRTYDIFAAYWPNQSSDDPISAKLNSAPKFVVSRTLQSADWDGTTILADVADVAAVRDRYDEVHLIGSGTLSAALLDAGLVDRIHLWLYPVTLGTGKRFLTEGLVPRTFALAEPPRVFSQGAISLVYAPAGDVQTGDMT